MNANDLVRHLHEHRMWVNHRLLEAVGPLSESQLRQPLAIGQGSVWKTLTHLMGAEYTTAQLVNMLRQLGQTEWPDVMLITLARQ